MAKNNKNVPEKFPLQKVVFRTKDGENTTIGGTKVSEWGVEGYLGYWDADAKVWVSADKIVYSDGAELDVSEGYIRYFYKGTDDEPLGMLVSASETDMERNSKWDK